MNKLYSILYSPADIEFAVNKLALQIKKDYQGKKITIICILKGALVFTTDLMRHLPDSDIELDFIRCQSYTGTKSSGTPILFSGPHIMLNDKNILIVEDIIDTGKSLLLIQKFLKEFKPKDLKTCVLLDKSWDNIKVDYIGMKAPADEFVIGYGLDYNEQYRNLPGIFTLNR